MIQDRKSDRMNVRSCWPLWTVQWIRLAIRNTSLSNEFACNRKTFLLRQMNWKKNWAYAFRYKLIREFVRAAENRVCVYGDRPIAISKS